MHVSFVKVFKGIEIFEPRVARSDEFGDDLANERRIALIQRSLYSALLQEG